MSDRDDANIRHFKSRAQQPKLIRDGPAPGQSNIPGAPVNVYIVFDSDFGGHSNQIDDTRFKYVGTSPSLSQYEQMCGRRHYHASMGDNFYVRSYQ